MKDASPTDITRPSTPRYDGQAVWYDGWTRTTGAQVMRAADDVLTELIEPGHGLALDIGCGTGAHTTAVRGLGYRPFGVDYSFDQLTLAATQMPSIQADARSLPIADNSVCLAYSVLTHTDLDDFDRMIDEALRVITSGGELVYVGVHPCFVNPQLEQLETHTRQHPGYRDIGWQTATPFIGNAVRQRVGVHHLTLEALLGAFIRPNTRFRNVIERGGTVVPQFIGLRVQKTTN